MSTVTALIDRIRAAFTKGQLNPAVMAGVTADLAQAVEDLNDGLGSASAGPYSTVLFVNNVIGNDVTAVRGNQNLPFATIQAALNAMQTKDTVQLASQTFTQAQLTVPATVVTGACVGYKQPAMLNTTNWPGTEIRSTGANSWEFGANLGISRWLLADIMHQGGIISADGSVAPYVVNTFFLGGLWILNCTGFITAKYASEIHVQGPHGNGQYIFTGCNILQMQRVLGPGGNFTVTWDAADPMSTPTQQGLQLVGGSQVGTVTMLKQARVTIDEFSRTSSVIGSGLNVSGAFTPQLVCCGAIGGIVDFASAGAELPDTALVCPFDLRGTRFYYDLAPASPSVGLATPIKFKVGGAAANFQTVQLDGSFTLPATTIIADAAIHITGRGASWPGVILQTPGANGDINPPSLTGTIDISAGGALAKTWVQLGYAGLIRTGAAPDTAFLTASAQLADPVITTKATTGLTITSNVLGGNTACNWMAVWK